MWKVEIVIPGFPGKTSYGKSGLSAIYLICGKKAILFDTGSFGGRRRMLPVQLEKMGFSVDKISDLIISHAHYDHMINFQFFQNANIYIHNEDLKYADSKFGEVDLSYPLPYMQELMRAPNLKLIDKDEIMFDEIKLIHTPGHTPGSISAVVETSWGTTVLTGDAIKNRAEFLCNSYDKRVSNDGFLESIEKITNIADAIAPGHDIPFDARSGDYLLKVDDMVIAANFHKDIQKKSYIACARPTSD